jgi:hypothetical protein
MTVNQRVIAGSGRDEAISIVKNAEWNLGNVKFCRVHNVIIVLEGFHGLGSHCWTSQSRAGGTRIIESVITFENCYKPQRGPNPKLLVMGLKVASALDSS